MNRRGFTFLELLLAILLVTAGLASLLQASSAGLFSGGVNESEQVALWLAQEKIEQIRNVSYASVVNESAAAVSGFSAFSRSVTVTTPQSNLKQVSVDVSWASKNQSPSVSLVTYVSNI